MPLELFFSNRIEQLAIHLAENLFAGGETRPDPLAPIRLVIPNRNLAKWLQLSLARRLGVSMNIDFAYLDAALWELLIHLHDRGLRPLPVDHDIYILALLRVLENLPSQETLYDPIRAYLTPAGAGSADAEAAQQMRILGDTRRWQLAARLAQLFLEYELNRPEWMPSWQAGRFEGDRMTLCQGNLYRRTLAVCDRVGEALGRPIMSLPQLAREALTKAGNRRRTAVLENKVLNIFGLSQISTFHTDLIGQLSPHMSFRVFALNPSEAFWEDVRTPRERRWAASRLGKAGSSAIPEEAIETDGGLGLFAADDHPLLSLWGKPGRENIRRWCELAGYDFQASFRSPQQPPSVLGRLQESLRTADGDGSDGGQDTSVQVIACPGRLREVETVYQRILFYLEMDPALNLTDIAVLVPDMTAYKPILDAVFQRHPHQLSYSLVDTLAETESHYGRGALALLDLISGRFSRAEVLGLMMNPLFLARWSVDMEMVAVWAGWVEALNIYHSFDAQEKSEAGGASSPRYTWQQGLRRLRLGRIMETQAPMETAFKGLLPYADLESGDLKLLERFCLAVENLHGHVVRLRQRLAVDPSWPEVFLNACSELMWVGPEEGGETAVQRTLSTAFETLADFSRGSKADPSSHILSVELLRAFVAKHLRGLSTAHGDYLIGGVTVAALQPMRPIPFKILFILGMEEGGLFPGRADNSSLDLRLVKRRRGDVNTLERNNYLFLEALLSARQRLVISYVCRDLQRDRDLSPCAPVHQLKRFISDHLLSGGAEFKEQRVPLKSSDPAFLTPQAPPAWADPLVNANLLDRILALKTVGAWPPPAGAIPEALGEQVAALTQVGPEPAPRPAPADAPVRIFVEELRRFLLNPIPVKLARHLGVHATRPPLETLLAHTDEPFTSDFPTDFLIVRESLDRWLEACWQDPHKPPAMSELFQRVYAAYALRGAVPEGPYERLDQRRLGDQVIQWAAALAPLVEDLKAAAQRHHRVVIGHTDSAAQMATGVHPTTHHLPPMILPAALPKNGQAFPAVELSGEFTRLWQDRAGEWHSLILTGSQKAPAAPSHHLIAPVLTYLVAVNAAFQTLGVGQGGFTLHLAAKAGLRRFRYRIDPEDALKHLRAITGSYLDLQRHHWLPFQVITTGRLRVQDLLREEIDDRRRQRFLEALLESWDESGDYVSRLVKPSFELDCLDQALRRVAVFFAHEEA